MKVINIFLKIILCSLVVLSCSNGGNDLEAERAFSEMYKSCEMNEKLRLSYVGGLFDGDNSINLRLEPSTNISVTFPAGANLRLLSFDKVENKWVEVNNGVSYFPNDGKYILGKNDPVKEFSQKLIGVIPVLSKKEILRAVVYGNVYENGVETDQCTGAFIDFEYTP